MKGRLLVAAGLVACALAYGGVYLAATAPARSLKEEPAPELAWLRREYKLSDQEFKRICDLHAAYLPTCKEMCARIAQKNAETVTLLAQATNVTREVQTALNEAAQLRAQCQAQMLAHFFAVSRTMAPEQGRRYLAWIREKTLPGEGGMGHAMEHDAAKGHTSHH